MVQIKSTLKVFFTKFLILFYLLRLPCQNKGGPFAGTSFVQTKAYREAGVPSPISGGTGLVGSGWAGIWNTQANNAP